MELSILRQLCEPLVGTNYDHAFLMAPDGIVIASYHRAKPSESKLVETQSTSITSLLHQIQQSMHVMTAGPLRFLTCRNQIHTISLYRCAPELILVLFSSEPIPTHQTRYLMRLASEQIIQHFLS